MTDTSVNSYAIEPTDLSYMMALKADGTLVRGTNPVNTTKAQMLQNKSMEVDTTSFVDQTDTTKGLQFDVSGFTTATTHTVIWPNASGTVVLDTASLSMSNKTFEDATTLFADNLDPTKQFKFQASGIATGTLRTLAVPDIDDTLATLNGTENFTHKTLSGATFNGTIDGTPIYSGTQTVSAGTATSGNTFHIWAPTDFGPGNPELLLSKSTDADTWDWIVYDGSTTAGTVNWQCATAFQWNGVQLDTISGAYILSNKTLLDPVLSGTMTGGTVNATNLQIGSQDVSMVKISAQTITGSPASITFTSIPSSGFSKYLLVMEDVYVEEAAASSSVKIHVSTDNGSTWKTSSGDYYDTTPTAQTYLCQLGAPGNTSTFKHGFAEVFLYGLGNASRATVARTVHQEYWTSVTNHTNGPDLDCGRSAAEADNAIRILAANSSTLGGGTVTLYGMRA